MKLSSLISVLALFPACGWAFAPSVRAPVVSRWASLCLDNENTSVWMGDILDELDSGTYASAVFLFFRN